MLISPSRRSSRRSYKYNLRLIRRDLSYSISDIADLYGLHPNAVRRWIPDGLPLIDSHKPQLIHGSDLIYYLKRRQQARKRGCEPCEMYCCRCRAPRQPAEGKVTVDQVNPRQIMIRGACELCGTRMNRGGLVQQLADIEAVFTVTARSLRLNETIDPLVNCYLNQETGNARL